MILFALLQRLLAVVSLAILGAAGWLLWFWWDQRDALDDLGRSPDDRYLYWGLGLLAFSLLGRLPMLLLLGRPGPGADAGKQATDTVLTRDGADLAIEASDGVAGPIILMTHGWGMSQRIWGQARRTLQERYAVVSWDLPGAGRSGRPEVWSIEGFADGLKAVIDTLPIDRPIVLVGHSIGGMTIQTMCARHPQLLGKRVAGIVLENTTHRNPLETMVASGFFKACEPLIKVLMRLDIALSPLVWLMNWQSYMSGMMHLAMRVAGYGKQPTWAVLDLSSRLPARTSPAVQAHGNLAMIDWSVTDRLPSIDVPALVFVGTVDLVTKDHAGETISATLPRADLIRVGGAGHMGPFEQPDAYNDEIVAFIERVAAPRVAPVTATA